MSAEAIVAIVSVGVVLLIAVLGFIWRNLGKQIGAVKTDFTEAIGAVKTDLTEAIAAWLLNDIAEYKGKQGLFSHQSPQILKALRAAAIVQSAESSNRIEGVTVKRERLQPLVLGQSTPRDRSEQEVVGYRLALNEIHSAAAALAVTPDNLQRLHALCLSARGDAGQFKRVDNDIVELRPGPAPVVRFRCVSADETPAAVDELCQRYRYALDQDNIPPLIAIVALVLDFLCTHPFRDGNGRVSRLRLSSST